MNPFDRLAISIQKKWNGIDTQGFDDEKPEIFAKLMENKCPAPSQNEKISSIFFKDLFYMNEGDYVPSSIAIAKVPNSENFIDIPILFTIISYKDRCLDSNFDVMDHSTGAFFTNAKEKSLVKSVPCEFLIYQKLSTSDAKHCENFYHDHTICLM